MVSAKNDHNKFLFVVLLNTKLVHKPEVLHVTLDDPAMRTIVAPIIELYHPPPTWCLSNIHSHIILHDVFTATTF
jgi:hypothetical protein